MNDGAAEPVELVILCGLQASGKSTFRRHRFPEHVVVSKDRMRNNRRKDRRQQQLVTEALAEGRPVVVDNTNPRREDRAPLISLAHTFGARVIGFYLDVDFGVCLARNALRQGRDAVPEIGLIDVARRLQVPALDEGFDELYVVRADADRFEVEPLA